MAIVELERIVYAPVARVYEASQDYAIRYQWDPFPEKIELLGGAVDVAIGVRTLVVARSGLRMEVEFVQVSPPHRAAIVMVRGPLLLKTFAGSWVFKQVDPTTTQVTFRYSIQMKPWTLPKLSERLACGYFRRVVKARVEGLKAYCEGLQGGG